MAVRLPSPWPNTTAELIDGVVVIRDNRGYAKIFLSPEAYRGLMKGKADE